MFYLAIADRSQIHEGFRFFAGRLVLGEDLQFLRCASGFWRPTQYRHQWHAAANRLATHPMATSAFVTSVAKGVNNLEWWLARRRGRMVTFTNQLLFLRNPPWRVVPVRAHEYKHRPTYQIASQKQRLSEWRLPYSAIQRYVRQTTEPNRAVKGVCNSQLRRPSLAPCV